MLQADLREHFDRLDDDQADALMFSSPAGTPMRHSNFYRRAWLPAVAEGGPTSPEVGSNCTDGG
jgi:hypothetical protein